MSQPGFPSGSSFIEGTTDKTMQNIGPNLSSNDSSSQKNQIPGYASAGMGLVQMAVGLYQLNKANKLPFPSYQETKGPYTEMKSIYQNNMTQGIGSEQRANMAMQNAKTQAQQNYAISQNAPQASSLFGRTAALDRTSGALNIAQQDYAAKVNAMSGVERMNQALTAIEQKDIAAQRDYRIRAEQAAGQAIARGSENIANSLGAGSTA